MCSQMASVTNGQIGWVTARIRSSTHSRFADASARVSPRSRGFTASTYQSQKSFQTNA